MCVKNLDKRVLLLMECLKDTVERVVPYWHDVIVRTIRSRQKVLVTVLWNSLWTIIKYLDKVSDDEIVQLNLPAGVKKLKESKFCKI